MVGTWGFEQENRCCGGCLPTAKVGSSLSFGSRTLCSCAHAKCIATPLDQHTFCSLPRWHRWWLRLNTGNPENELQFPSVLTKTKHAHVPIWMAPANPGCEHHRAQVALSSPPPHPIPSHRLQGSPGGCSALVKPNLA